MWSLSADPFRLSLRDLSAKMNPACFGAKISSMDTLPVARNIDWGGEREELFAEL